MEDMSNEEIGKLLDIFKTLKSKPNVDSVENFQKWMSEHSQHIQAQEGADSKEAVQEEVKTRYPSSSMQHFPKISPFSGDDKKETTYDVWRSQVECIIKEGHPQQTVSQAIRRSLKGEALRVRSRLPPEAGVGEILAKMDSVFGIVEQPEMLLANFFSAKQEPSETVSAWSCRVEDLFTKAADANNIPLSKQDTMLRTVFWSGLNGRLKDATGHLYILPGSFDSLRIAIRRVEQDHTGRAEEKGKQPTPKPGKSAVVVETKEPVSRTEMDEIKGMINQLSVDFKTLGQNQQGKNPYPRQNKFKGKQSGKSEYEKSGQETRSEPTCYRCGREGHISRGCRALTDHQGKPLNGQGPGVQGKRLA
ncbi:uncharacterized protein LOC117319736 [Pecten maximus]|uniref:uncharacterized protein LOC117319736 n=1 Tax=Pecten maximus TaxID=6579 RepID=UPI0014582426|nr:uncharacterized protein LOC117319736 [Pecten maximus]